MTQRIADGIRFDTGIRNTDFSDKPVGQTTGQPSTALLPSGTTVSEAIKDVFNLGQTVSGEIMQQMVAAYANPKLRTASGFHSALKNALKNMKARKGKHSGDAAQVLQELMEDTDLLDQYRASIVES